MTSRPVTATPDTEKVRQFPDVPPEEMTAFRHVNYPAYPASLALHFGNQETTVITSELAAGLRETESYEGILFPRPAGRLWSGPQGRHRAERLPDTGAGQAARLRAGGGV